MRVFIVLAEGDHGRAEVPVHVPCALAGALDDGARRVVHGASAVPGMPCGMPLVTAPRGVPVASAAPLFEHHAHVIAGGAIDNHELVANLRE